MQAVHRAGLKTIARGNQYYYRPEGGIGTAYQPAAVVVPRHIFRAQRADELGYSVAHEVGHHLTWNPPIAKWVPGKGIVSNYEEPQGAALIARERKAWAAGMRWAKHMGFNPRLAQLKRVLGRTLVTYGTASTPWGRKSQTMGTPRERRNYNDSFPKARLLGQR